MDTHFARLGAAPCAYTIVESPVGPLLLARDGKGLCSVAFIEGRRSAGRLRPAWVRHDEAFRDVAAQLEEYFAGRRQEFDLAVAPSGTPFQQRVWAELCRIPYGSTISYAELARRIGNAPAIRAVGLATGANPIAIVVPCHRVVGADGSLVGFGGGLPAKRHLLDLERRLSGGAAAAADVSQPLLTGFDPEPGEGGQA